MRKKLALMASDSSMQYAIIHAAETGSLFFASSCDYDSCMDLAGNGGAEAMILEIDWNVAELQDLLFVMERSGHFCAILVYEVTEDGKISYTVSEAELLPLSEDLETLFRSAVSGIAGLQKEYYRTAPDNSISPAAYGIRHGRTESLKEILRGASRRETEKHMEYFSLDLKEKGYFLYFWELRFIEYREHRSYKDIHNHIGDAMLRCCRQILQEYNGGEPFYLSLTLMCIIINDLPIKSETQHKAGLEELQRRLAVPTGSRQATRYFSQRVGSLWGLRDAYELYAVEKAAAFFMRGNSVVLSSELKSRKKDPDFDEINQCLERINNYLRYDLRNPDLDEEIRRLYFGNIKSSMNFAVYYYCTSVIFSDMIRAQISENPDFPYDNLNPALLQFTSIEEQYSKVLEAIELIRGQHIYKRKTKSQFVMKAMEYIAEHYRESISVADVSGMLYISSTYLSQIFKSMTGVSVVQYLINYRVEKAKQLLEETDFMVYSVAEQVGFRDMRHFSKTFKKCTGFTPTEYRQRFKRKS